MAPNRFFSDGSFSKKGCALLSTLNARIQRNSEGKSLLSSCSFSPFQSASNFPRWHFFTSKTFEFTNVYFSPFTSLSHFYSNLLEDELICNRTNEVDVTLISRRAQSGQMAPSAVLIRLRCSYCHNVDTEDRRLKATLAPSEVRLSSESCCSAICLNGDPEGFLLG